jgi:tetratricopeptide (TPR) repeat protein
MHSETYQRIEHLIDLRRLDHAQSEIENALKADPKDTELLYLSAYIYWLEELYDEGIEIAEVGLSYSPENEKLKYVLFLLLRSDEQYEKAETLIIDLIRNNPRDDDYLRGYAYVMLFTFHLSKAKKLIAEAMRIAPDSSSNQLIATLIDIADGKLKDADRKLERLVKDNPDDEHILNMLLIQLISKNKYRAAQVLAQTLLRKNPNDHGLIKTIISLRTSTHWSAIPLWPITRFGWMGSIGMWGLFVVLLTLNKQINHPAFGYVVWGYLAWCVYSWIHEPIFTRIFKSRGV